MWTRQRVRLFDLNICILELTTVILAVLSDAKAIAETVKRVSPDTLVSGIITPVSI